MVWRRHSAYPTLPYGVRRGRGLRKWAAPYLRHPVPMAGEQPAGRCVGSAPRASQSGPAATPRTGCEHTSSRRRSPQDQVQHHNRCHRQALRRPRPWHRPLEYEQHHPGQHHQHRQPPARLRRRGHRHLTVLLGAGGAAGGAVGLVRGLQDSRGCNRRAVAAHMEAVHLCRRPDAGACPFNPARRRCVRHLLPYLDG